MARSSSFRPRAAQRPPHSTGPRRSAPRYDEGRGDESSASVVYGRHPVLELLESRPAALEHIYIASGGSRAGGPEAALAQILTLAEQAGIRCSEVERSWLDSRCSGGQHQGVVASTKPFAYTALDELIAQAPLPRLFVVLDQVQDPHNLGALARSALALGAHGLILAKDRSAQVTPAAFKASAGALAHLGVARVTNLARALAALREAGVWIIGTACDDHSVPPTSVDWRLCSALVIGNEGTGLRPSTAAACDRLTHIPIARIGSLNASIAGAICLYEANRQRQQHPPLLALDSP